MKNFIYSLTFLLILAPYARSQPISLVRAAELATKFVEGEKIDGKPFLEFFTSTALRRIPASEPSGPSTVVWKVELEVTQALPPVAHGLFFS